MKKLFLFVAVVVMLLPSCKKINEAIDGLDNRLDKLEQETIPSIDEQISAINTTLENLDSMDKELKGYIDNLTTTASSLQEQINAANAKIEEVKTALQSEISTAKSEVLAQLATAKTELENELAQINATIETLKAKDAELDNKIAELRSYVDNELGKTTDWVNATFATLEQYNALVAEIATIKEQIKAINQSITELETRLTTKINADITAAVASLNADIQQKVSEITEAYTNAVKTAKEEITSAYTTAIQTAITTLDNSLKTWVGEQLANYYTIAQIDALLAALEQDMNGKLEAQKAYLEGLINELSATLTKSIADNKVLIEGLQKDIATLQGTAAEHALKIAENATAISTNAQSIIENSTAISKNSDNIEANKKLIADNKALIENNSKLIEENKRTIEALKSSTATAIAKNATDINQNANSIAKNASLISQNATAITNNAVAIAQNATDIAQLQQNLTTTKLEITEAYKKAIKEAIEANNGAIEGMIANAVATINTRINNEVATINATIKALIERIESIESEISSIKQQIAEILGDITDIKEDIAALLARIQSVSYIPTYDDGKATVKYNGITSRVTLDFEVSPKDAVVELAKVWQSAVSVKAIYTQTRAVSFIDMPIVNFESDPVNGVISVIASAENLSSEFFNGTKSASARLSISDGNNSVVSEYVPMIIEEVPNNEIWYTSSDGNIITPYATDVFGANIISNTYEDGIGIIRFDGDVTSIGKTAFTSCTSLTSITIPNSVTSIPSYAFENCTSLTSVTIPNSVTSIGSYAFRSCTSLTAFYGKFASADNLCLIVNGQLNSFAIGCGLTQYTIPNSVTSIGNCAFFNCTSLTSVTIPNSATSIGSYAFRYCTSLTSITISDGVTKIGGGAFRDCTSLTSVYCKPTTPPTISNNTFENVLGCKIYVPDTSIDTYKAAKYWSDLSSNIVGKKFNPANNEIWYTSNDGNIVTPYATVASGANIVSNTYENGIGTIVFNGNVTSIGDLAFYNCTSLTSVTIPNSVTEIGDGAFGYCDGLTSITIPNSVTEIGRCAFSGCNSLSVYCNPTTPPGMVVDYDAGGEEYYDQFAEGVIIYVLLPYVNTYKQASGWSNYANNIVGY